MLTERKIPSKLEQIEQRYAALRFEKLADIPMQMAETREHFRQEPGPEANLAWQPAAPGLKWGDNWASAWFCGDITLPESTGGKRVFVRAQTGGETLFFVDGCPRGVFDDNHPVVMMASHGVAGRSYRLAFEAYAGHFIPGVMPAERKQPEPSNSRTFNGIELVLEREDVSGFVFDLKVLRQLVKALDEHSLRRNRVLRELACVFAVVDAMPDEVPEAQWHPKLAQAREIMRPLLECHNGSTAPFMGIIGHSHIDTAWLWPLEETWRKCARTFSSVINLMEQYPEFLFMQSAPCHTDAIRREYPWLFEQIRDMVAAGRWEPNGAMWVEPDCNLASGEALARQLLVGQRATREWFGYTADTLWMPDVFGYSAALPQLLRQAGVRFFCTTKIAWNDTNRFPYDTFTWKGIDGSSVLAHFNAIHCWPDPETLTAQWNWVQHKDVQDRRLCAYGFGDGGGGPMAEMIEVSRRVADLEGCPRARHVTVGRFMQGIADELPDMPEHQGELYLEGHRGTLTSIAAMKRGNRVCELALRDAELACTLAALRGAAYPAAALLEQWKLLLVNQFHDILPGSSIAEVNDKALETFGQIEAQSRALTTAAARALAGGVAEARSGGALLVLNSLSWPRSGELVLDDVPAGLSVGGAGVVTQRITGVDGTSRLAVGGITLPALGWASLPLATARATPAKSAFRVQDDNVETPFAVVRFDAQGRIVSWFDKAALRELVRAGGALNTWYLGEDIPEAWDNWDIDADHHRKQRPAAQLLRRETVADGPLQLRLRSEFRLGGHSTVVQDLVFHALTPRIDFESRLDWQGRHQLLKVGFDLNVLTDTARHEIQFGHVERPVHANLPQDRARFEVCAHKWTDLSDNGFGVALLNDCKYGIGVRGSELRLSLIKSGTHPDSRGDAGTHLFRYALQPHAGGFAVETVVQPAYEFNVALPAVPAPAATAPSPGLLSLDAPNVIVEAVKWAEDEQAFVVRLYEAGKRQTRTRLRLHRPVSAVRQVNLLEETQGSLEMRDGALELEFHPFEVKTLLCSAGGCA